MPIASGPLLVDGAQPSAANPLPISAPSVIDTGNSTTVALEGDATFPGEFTPSLDYAQVVIRCSSDVPGILYFESSADGLTVQGDPVPLNSGLTAPSIIGDLAPTLEYFRLRYVNGSTPQGSFFLDVRLNRIPHDLTNSAAQPISDYTRVAPVRIATDIRLDEASGRHADRSTILKFGYNPDVAASTEEDIWEGGGFYTGWLTTASTVRVAAGGNSADTDGGTGAWNVKVYGLSATGVAQTSTLTLAGASASAASSEVYSRVYRMQVTLGGALGYNVGDIVLEAVTGSYVMAKIGRTAASSPIGTGQTAQAVYTIPAGYVGYVRRVSATVGGSKAATVRWWERPPGGYCRRRWRIAPQLVGQYTPPEFGVPAGPFAAGTDLWVSAVGPSGSGVAIAATFDVVLATA